MSSYTSYSSASTRSSSESSTSSSGSLRHSLDAQRPSRGSPSVEIMRCSRCAKCVETVINGTGLNRVSSHEAQANGMVRFGHNLYYCDRCAKMVGYKRLHRKSALQQQQPFAADTITTARKSRRYLQPKNLSTAVRQFRIESSRRHLRQFVASGHTQTDPGPVFLRGRISEMRPVVQRKKTAAACNDQRDGPCIVEIAPDVIILVKSWSALLIRMACRTAVGHVVASVR
ncbi:hypothetical protein BP6252_07634 [Coleophoma cylindrospora]|uniref:Uncharacterized protein n=1 Tax=Coleophoma cylindrospora TaxID=1849047 RepID=A0A3D8RB13_9HELO|nr:hypothetical protein BP6252_07634 [Coleophoma cylindrospora]